MSTNKTTITGLLLFFAFFYLYNHALAQDKKPTANQGTNWFDLLQNPESKFNDVVNSANAYFSSRDINQKGTGYKVFKRWEYINENRVLPDGKLQKPDYILNEFIRYSQEMDGIHSSGGNWSIVGPVNYPVNATIQPTGLGRINTIAFHPTDANTIFVGAPSGGIWKTNDGGSTWVDLSANMPKLGVSAILIHPTNPNIIYIGTGDRDANDAPGIGVYKSTDGGSTWIPFNNSMGNVIVGHLIMHPSDPNTILAATSGGIYKTTNGGSTWLLKSVVSNYYKDIRFKPGNPLVVYASGGGKFYRSSNTGESWTEITSGISSGGRMVIGVSPANNNYVYICRSNSNNSFGGVYLSTDAGLNFTLKATGPNIFDYKCDGSGSASQASYDLCIAVDPVNADIVYIGSINNWKSTNAGLTFTCCSHWVGSGFAPSDPTANCGASVHADQHALEWSPLNGRLYVGNDGGIYYSADGGTTWPQISSGLAIAQVYKIGQSAKNSNMTINGYQDNGAAFNNGTSFTTIAGGDAGEGVIDYIDQNFRYNASTTGNLRRTTSGNTYTSIANLNSNGITGESSYWLYPFLLHETDPNTMFLGYKQVYRSTNVKTSTATSVIWTAISTGETSTCRVLEQSAADVNIIYAYREGSLKRSDNANDVASSVNWTTCNLPSTSNITDLETHPTDANIVYATAGYQVFKSTDKGLSWTNISGNLPNLFINTIIINRNANEGLYIGNQTGVWYKDATMTNWMLFSSGLPPVDVRELDIYYDAIPANSRLKAATYGRGLWESELAEVNVIDPYNFRAYEGSTRIDLTWSKNAANDNVIIAWAPINTFGQPVDGTAYLTENSIPGGGTVLYVGPASTAPHIGLSPTTTYYYKAWSVNGSNQYSAGVVPVSATTDCEVIASLPYTNTFDEVSCWKIVDYTENRSWQIGNTINSSNPPTLLTAPYAYFKSSPGSQVNYNSDLISPPLNLSALSNVVLQFNHHYDGDPIWASIARVYYTTDNGLNWILLTTYTTDQNNTTIRIVVPGAAGQSNVKFKWNYFDDATGSYMWGIDNVEVKQCTGIWNGSVSTNWHTPGNWCDNTVPTAATDVIIPAGATNMPDISTSEIATCRDITIQNGETLKMSGDNSVLEVKGNWVMNGSFDYINSSNTSRVIFNGTTVQYIGGSTNTRLIKFTIDNTSGISLSTELRSDNDIQLTNGIVTTTGSGKIYDVYSKITRTNGWVNGTLQKYLWYPNNSVENRTFQIGDAYNYTPVTLSFPIQSITSTGPISLKTMPGDHANISTSTLNGNKSVNRYWSFPTTGSFTFCNATFNFVSGDLDAGVNSNNLIAGQYKSSAWSYPSVGTKTATSTQVTGLTSASLGDIQLSEGPTTFSGTGNWSDAARWSTGLVPISTDNVIIDGNAMINSSVIINDLSINATRNLTIAAGQSLTAIGTLINNAGNTGLIIKSDATGTGSLIQNSSNVPATIERYITGEPEQTNSTKYHLVSRPFAEDYTSNEWNGSYLFESNEPGGNWLPVGASTTYPCYTKKGYLLYYPADSKTYSHTGNLVTGNQTFGLTYQGPTSPTNYRGYNLIPNIFPCALDFSNAANWTGSANISNKIWIWSSNDGNYGSKIRSGASTNSVTDIIPVGQSFFVEASQNGNLTISDAARIHNSAQLYLKNSDVVDNTLNLKVKANNFGDEIAIQLRDDATSDYDTDFEAKKREGQFEAPQLSAIASDNCKLSIGAFPLTNFDLIVPLHFTLNTTTSATFTASGFETFTHQTPIYLEDLLINKIINLRENPVYTFSHIVNTTPNRFQLRFKNTNGIDNKENIVQGSVIVNNNNLVITIPSMNDSEVNIDIIDILGRNLSHGKTFLNGTTQIKAPIATGVYIVKVTNGKNTFTQKVLIN